MGIKEAVSTPCSDCPFRKDSRSQAYACYHLTENIKKWEGGRRNMHSCHKTDPRADGYIPKVYKGPIKACAGALASGEKSGIPFELKVDKSIQNLVWSFDEIRKVYKSALRRHRRWYRKKDRILKIIGLRDDCHDRFITDYAVSAGLAEKDYFFSKLRELGFLLTKEERAKGPAEPMNGLFKKGEQSDANQ